MTPRLYTLDEAADLLRYSGKDRARSVRRLFERHGVAILKRDGRTFLVAENRILELMEAMTCSPCENGKQPTGIIAAGRKSLLAPRYPAKTEG